MSSFEFQADTVVNIITKALDDLLRDKRLKLTAQKYERLKKVLMVRFLDDACDYSDVYNYLSDITEYRKDYEIDANAPDEAEEEMIHILAAADIEEVEIEVKTSIFKKRYIAALTALLLICAVAFVSYTISHLESKAIATVDSDKLARVITTAEEAELKSLVWKVVELEKERGKNTKHNTVYSRIKRLDTVRAYGPASSYKKFNHAQFFESRIFLNQWIKDIGAGIESAGELPKVSYKFKSTNISISDGDTFKTYGKTYRLWGVDTFEMKQKCADAAGKAYTCGENAKQALTGILNEVKSFDCLEHAQDRYGRSVVECSVNGESLGSLLVLSGWAVDYTQYSKGKFKSAENQARADKTGAWAGCFQAPWDYRHGAETSKCY